MEGGVGGSHMTYMYITVAVEPRDRITPFKRELILSDI